MSSLHCLTCCVPLNHTLACTNAEAHLRISLQVALQVWFQYSGDAGGRKWQTEPAGNESVSYQTSGPRYELSTEKALSLALLLSHTDTRTTGLIQLLSHPLLDIATTSKCMCDGSVALFPLLVHSLSFCSDIFAVKEEEEELVVVGIFNSAASRQALSPCRFITLAKKEWGDSWDLTTSGV